MNYRNLGIKQSKGKFYESFKTPQPNAETFEKDGITYYHVLYDVIEGELHSIQIEEGEYGTKLRISLTDSVGDAQVLKFPLLDGRGGVDDFAKSISVYLDQLNIGDQVTLSLNTKEKDKKGYLYKNFFVKVDETNLKFSFSHKEAPPGEKRVEKDKVTKKEKEVWDFTAKNSFYYDKIAAQVERLSGPVAATAGYTDQVVDDIPMDDGQDSLPF